MTRDSRPLGTAEEMGNFGNPGTLIGSETVDLPLSRNCPAELHPVATVTGVE